MVKSINLQALLIKINNSSIIKVTPLIHMQLLFIRYSSMEIFYCLKTFVGNEIHENSLHEKF